MSSNDYGANFVLDQRYYHFVVLKDARGLKLSEYWRRVGKVVTPANAVAYRTERFEIQHRKLRTDKAFARGAVGEALSEKGRGRPPFLYDLMAIQMTLRGDSYVALGFPFVDLGLDLVRELIDRQNLLRPQDFLGVDVPLLIKKAETGFQSFDDLNTHIVGVQFVVTDDKSLTAVRLGGDDPLSAQIYVEFLQEKVSRGFILPDRCVLACQREWPVETPPSSATASRSYRSRLHVDGHGHFKFYTQIGCRNLRLLPFALGQLRAAGCFQKVSGNPLLKARRDEAE